jgi:hypothetical protein
VGAKILKQFGPALVRISSGLMAVLETIGTSLPTILKYAGVYFAATTGMWAMEKAIKAVTFAINLFTSGQKVAAKAMAVVQALSGPKGWAVLAAGLVAAGGATVAIDSLFASLEKKAQAAGVQTSTVSAAVQSVAAKQSAMANFASAMEQVDAATGGVSAEMASLADSAGDVDMLTASVEKLGNTTSKVHAPGKQVDTVLAATMPAFAQASRLDFGGRAGLAGAGIDIAKVEAIREQFAKLSAEPGIAGDAARQARKELLGIIDAFYTLRDAQQKASTPESLKPENIAAARAEYAQAIAAFQQAVSARTDAIGSLEQKLKDTVAVFGSFEKAASFAGDALNEIKTPQEKLEETRKKIEALAALGLDGGKKTELLAKAMEDYDQALGGPANRIEEMRVKLEQMTLGLSDAQMELRKFSATKGVSPEQISQMQTLADQIDAATKHKELADKAKQIKEEMQTPAEKLAAKRAEVQVMVDAGALTREQADRAIAMNNEERRDFQSPGAMERGSREQWSNLVQSMGASAAGNKPMEQVAKSSAASEQHLAAVAERAAGMERLLQRLESKQETVEF